jgi:hypothetical protein
VNTVVGYQVEVDRLKQASFEEREKMLVNLRLKDEEIENCRKEINNLKELEKEREIIRERERKEEKQREKKRETERELEREKESQRKRAVDDAEKANREGKRMLTQQTVYCYVFDNNNSFFSYMCMFVCFFM